ncbi:YbaB/EbfC family nucleoid-associated protein [Plantactinospora sp. KLBMP9567]|uniref:YbaB/EbfC family nucleoid-associated protein n=1 Tax=Plantactinospora sp. KLBMP9567 TaxID=3085900 RepID=UPI0029829396|nr:YbaB/EbfC family nucleoid-associated protein [Plantactinospora sp. KLBMP9567]MDW5327945.1 YbaB/EbfC family nucleoid-associated protein [Plantactinospora sp. KLBMP9567]
MPMDDPPAAPADLVALEASIARTEAEWQRLQAATYEGSDPGRLVTSVVDGQGVVVRVTFAATIARHDPAVVEEAVRAAVTAAQQRLGDALAALAAEVAPTAPGAGGPAGDRTGADGWRTAGSEPAIGTELPDLRGGVLGRDDR